MASLSELASIPPPVLALGGLWIALIVVIPIALIALAIYSVYTLRKPENWEQR
jgi:flagellar basal body-associated protein FliL